MPTARINQRIADELGVRQAQVEAAVQLLDDGSTVPFIARYRKEVTQGLDDAQLRTLEERLGYLRELEDRRGAILASIEEQGKLTAGLRKSIEAADTKARLEDLYLPYRKKRRTKAQIAREAGLEPLADGLISDPAQDPVALAAQFVDPAKDVADGDAALEGARQILMERFAEDAELLAELRPFVWDHAVVRSQVAKGKENDPEAARFKDYFDYTEALAKIPSHRALALFRGRKAALLQVSLDVDAEGDGRQSDICIHKVAKQFGIRAEGRPADGFLLDAVRSAWRVKIFLHLDVELMSRLREAADEEAIRVFGTNLRELLLAAPAGGRPTMGLDPGLRTGVKVAVVDGTGKVLETATIYPHAPRNDWIGALQVLMTLTKKHGVELVAIGNGTASRETDKLVADLIRTHPKLELLKVMVSEAGASVYSASEFASAELPDMDVSLRGAVSIARRLQDPLAELVKIDPKSIGVGQYQHDVNQTRLQRKLDAIVEDCVNAVGVDVNTASVPLLTRVAGLTETLARNVVAFRDEEGAFRNRKQLLKVSRLGPKAFEQAAGFLRIRDGENPLDASAVHPEAYPVVERIVARAAQPVTELMRSPQTLQGLSPAEFVDEQFGEPTVRDILLELEKPGRDPRPEFKTATFDDAVQSIGDLRPDMKLEGVVTNVTNFGAFVDVGVHQDGLVHISCMSREFVEDPHDVVRAGDVVKVKVMEVDAARKRIALTMRPEDTAAEYQERNGNRGGRGRGAAKAERGGSGGGPARGRTGRGDRGRHGRNGGGGSSAPVELPRADPEVISPLAAQLAKLQRRDGDA